ncbi:MAG: hypothetical protein CMK85_12375 [Pseudomonadales bacterium]|jgi:hypothetical protein|uniref:Uncharacterized protein n=1 Tax=Halopseudomonas aestusnigri TaxID=857252 RepID=A0AAQ1JQJ9_9GAMM|nr:MULTISPECIES: hypothetical protein [Halopseudomonas]MAG99668.1 hypothetical protein [Pseudomonadales bacterium]HBT57146.1 hypothetical protein [Pseudomonas sp.]MAK74581.1 hypothetical protein [Pseudomonadales bacterium]MAP75648.1 hypothetical protein [Pseudomonadales bacterium]MBP77173.1 hypothetical protein [Pseudomonadales bacterium]|tara:strand:- start:1831 stop:2130 length:300 start_codon:yes stop_codon:yes gene_type:complete
MQLNSSSPFEWLGSAIGSVVRVVIDSLIWLFTMLSNASSDFINGFSRALGVNSNLLSIAAVILGLFLIYTGVRAFIRRKIVLGIIWVLLGLWLLSALIN